MSLKLFLKVSRYTVYIKGTKDEQGYHLSDMEKYRVVGE